MRALGSMLFGILAAQAIAEQQNTPIDVVIEKAPPPNPARKPGLERIKQPEKRMAPLKEESRPKAKPKSAALKRILMRKGRA